ncbi:MAG: hypothetical protein IJT94_09225 [Oscillibacter sp.]|nr:hypothetical protein [Oscillibacter sp.]
MNQTVVKEPPVQMWRVWIDNQRRIVSFHEEEGADLLEFRNEDMFLHCVEQYSGRQYRYQ